MKPAGELLLVLACAATGALGTWMITGPPSRVVPCDPATIAAEEICLATLQAEWPAGTFLWIDARLEDEWKRDGIEGSIHLSTAGAIRFEDQMEASLDRLGTTSRAVVYCGSAGCGISKEVVKRLKEYGMIPELRALHGGWEALHQAGLVKGSSRSN
jgi:rhodanese-related sulfurtransferase